LQGNGSQARRKSFSLYLAFPSRLKPFRKEKDLIAALEALRHSKASFSAKCEATCSQVFVGIAEAMP
jgi:hypothetical protein